jgi:hypothetical protein
LTAVEVETEVLVEAKDFIYGDRVSTIGAETEEMY